jgi:hypothetical protein
MKYKTGLSFEMISAGKHCNIAQMFTALEALICTGRIAEMTASCYMLLLLGSIFSVLSCCQASFLTVQHADILMLVGKFLIFDLQFEKIPLINTSRYFYCHRLKARQNLVKCYTFVCVMT